MSQLMDYFLVKKVEELKPYPLNKELFDELPKTDYDALKLDIQENGIKTELHILRNGMVLCGNQRLNIAKELGMKSVPIKFVEIAPEDETAIKEYVIIDNVLRRHLSTEQKYLLIAELTKSFEVGRGAKEGFRGNQYTSGKELTVSSLPEEKNDVNSKVAKKIGVSRDVVRKARTYAKIVKERPELKKESVKTALKKYSKEKKIEKIKQEAQEIAEQPVDTSYVIQGDVLQKILEIPDDSVHCVVTDPPYGIENHITRENSKEFDDGFEYTKNLLKETCKELKRVCSDNAHLYFFCGSDIILLNEFYQIISAHFEVQPWPLIWETNNQTICDYSKFYPRKNEFILFAKAERGNDRPLNEKCTPNILKFDKIPSKDRNHFSEKPVKLLETLINNSTQIGEIILDPFAGSGSTGEAAIKNNRKCLLIEKEENYVNVIKLRLSKLQENKAK